MTGQLKQPLSPSVAVALIGACSAVLVAIIALIPRCTSERRAENRAPVAATDSARVPSGEGSIIHVLANDSDPDGDPIHVRTASVAVHGQATIPVSDVVRYQSEPGFEGEDSFEYEVSDGRLVASAKVLLSVVQRRVQQVAINVRTLGDDKDADSVLVISVLQGGDVIGQQSFGRGQVWEDHSVKTLTVTVTTDVPTTDKPIEVVAEHRGLGHDRWSAVLDASMTSNLGESRTTKETRVTFDSGGPAADRVSLGSVVFGAR